jgi:hypothetical protein
MITFTRVITDEEQKMLEHDLLDIVEWINKAIDGKINNCAARAARLSPLKKKTEKETALEWFDDKDYKNRAQREAISNEDREPKGQGSVSSRATGRS